MKKIAFYAPIKPPDHPIPSGDRLIARNLMRALTLAGFETNLASSYIAYSKREAAEILREKKAGALVEADRVIAELHSDPPDLWLTYHPYCKAPDWIGPLVSKALGIPYVTVEAARTGQGFENNGDRWKDWRTEAQAGIRQADLHVCFKPSDKTYLTQLLGDTSTLADLPPFIDVRVANTISPIQKPNHWRPRTPLLVTTAMMRPGKKLKNFQLIADALELLPALDWNLVIIGDGPEEAKIRQIFSFCDEARICWAGQLPHHDVLAWMAAGDVFVWPGWKEPIGMVYLEAQLMGLPVVALRSMGVPLVVQHGKTGLLSDETDTAAFSENISTLVSHPSLRADFSRAASHYVPKHHSMKSAAETLRAHLIPLLPDKPLA